MNNFYALIMAGGGGTRLWPLSRKSRPKQLLSLVSEESMFRVSVTRLVPLFPIERIFVVTGASQVDDLKADVPELPAENFIIEPFGQDSGPAAGLGVAHIQSINPEAIIAILTADHHIDDVDGFRNALAAACEVAKQDYIVTLGIKPTFPSTGFGYIQRAEQLTTVNGLVVYHSAGFKEKPDDATARHFYDSGLYAWNSGMFIWKAAQAMREFEKHAPQIYQNLSQIQAGFGKDTYLQTINAVWQDMPKISLDFAVMEKAEKVAMIPVNIGWNDVGSWAAVHEILASNVADNIQMGTTEHIGIDSKGTLVNSKRLVVTIGLDDLVVIDTDDVLLICPRDRAQDVRQAVQHLKEKGLDNLL